MKKNLIFMRMVTIVSFLLIISLIIGIYMILSGDFNTFITIIGTVGVVGSVALFLTGYIIDIKSPKQDEDNSSNDYYNNLIELKKENPNIFDRKYKRLIRSGSLYIMFLFVLIILSMVGIIALAISLERISGGVGLFLAGLIAVIYVILKSLYIKYELSGGYLIDENSSPEIFEIINSACEKVGAPKPHKVLIGQDINCGVVEYSIGFGLKNERILFIGVYILMLLSKEEIESILIHEFAHIYNKDTLVANKINKNITRWAIILENCEKRGFIPNALLKNFGEGYIAKMQMFSSANSKSQEILADQEVVKHAGKDIHAKVLMKVEMLIHFFDKDLDINKIGIKTSKEPPKNFYSLIVEEFIKQFSIKETEWKKQILKAVSTTYDTHPRYKERLKAVGITNFDIDIAFKADTDSKEIVKIVEDFNNEWYKNAIENWEEYIAQYKKNKDNIKKYEISEDNNKNMEYAMTLEELSKNDEAIEIYELLLKKNPNYAPALFRRGLIYLDRYDEKGIDLIKRAIELNNDFIPSGLNVLSSYLDNNGLEEKKNEMNSWAIEKMKIHQSKIDELDNLSLKDIFFEAEISDEQRNTLKNNLETIDSIKRIYIATKKLDYSETNLLVVGVSSKQKILRLIWNGQKLYDVDKISEMLEALGIPYFFLDLNTNPFFTKKLSKVQNSLLIKR